MTPEEYAAAGKVYLEAMRLEPDARAEYVDRACGGDARLRSIVESWLATDTSTMDVTPVLGADSAPAPLPARIDEFEVIALLGQGGMGRVYLARQQSPDRRVAIKTLDPEIPMSRTAIVRFEAEAKYLARLHHDGIAQVYTTGSLETEHGRRPYLVMEWIEGGCSLTEYADRAGLDLAQRLALFLQLLDAVAHAHERGVIHRDLKPSNVLVTPEGRCKVLDFGIARARESEPSAAGNLTQRGEVMGTLPYMSPEQAQGRSDEIDVRTDVYALGVILFELIAGRLPFALPANGRDAIEMIATALPPRLNSVRPDVPRDVAAIVDAALAKSRDRRYHSVAALANDVRCVLEARPISMRRISTLERWLYSVRRSKAKAAAVVFLVLGLAGSATFGVKAWLADRTAEAREREKIELQVDAVFRLGEKFARGGDWAPALQQYDGALRAGHPDPIAIRLAMVEALEGMGDVRAARRIIDELSALPDADLGRHLALVLLYRADRTKVPEARFAPFDGDELLDRAIQLGTLSKADAAYAAALRSASAKDQLRHLQHALRFESHHRRANEMLVPTLLFSGHARAAPAAASEFRRLFPDDPAAQTIQLGVRAFLERAIPEDHLDEYPAVPPDVVAVLAQLVSVARMLGNAVDELLVRDLQRGAFGAPPTTGAERLFVLAPLATFAFGSASSDGAFESTFRVPPRLSETWFEVVGGLSSILFGGPGSSDALEFLSRTKTNNDDALIAWCAGVQRLLLNREDPSYWRDFAEAADRDSWLDVREVSLVMVVLAWHRHPDAVADDVALRTIRRLLRECEPDPLDFRFLWHASRAIGAVDARGEVFHRWRQAFPRDPTITEAEEWEERTR